MSWSKNGREVEDTGRFTFTRDGNAFSLTIPAALSTDSGVYTVTADSEAGSVSWSCTLVVAMGEASGGDEDRVKELLRSVEVRKYFFLF